MNNYLQIVIIVGFFSFIASMGIGTNDVAKSFTIKQEVILACIFETFRAILIGSHVSETIRKGITAYECF